MRERFGIYDLFPIQDNVLKIQPMCNTCIYRKVGVETLCLQYKMKPSGVIKGGYCGKYSGVEEDDYE